VGSEAGNGAGALMGMGAMACRTAPLPGIKMAVVVGTGTAGGT